MTAAADEAIAKANELLKTAKIRVSVERRGDSLWLRATLPPKPHINKPVHQQKVSLGLKATPAGIQSATVKARIMAAELDSGNFAWSSWMKLPDSHSDTITNWLERFEEDHWSRTKQTQKSLTTWKTCYLATFKRLDGDSTLSLEVLLSIVKSTEPDSRTRLKVCIYLHKLAEFANLPGREEIKKLAGNYSASAVNPRTLPTDKVVAEYYNTIESPAWRWVVGMLGAYGLRSHEVFRLDLEDFPVVRVVEGKTGARFVYPLYPEWAIAWQLHERVLPDLDLEYSNAKLSNKVSHYFYNHKLPFKALDLRHCYARRCFQFGLAPDWAAGLMGHSLQVHLNTYRAWIDEAIYRRAYEAVINRNDRPSAPC